MIYCMTLNEATLCLQHMSPRFIRPGKGHKGWALRLPFRLQLCHENLYLPLTCRQINRESKAFLNKFLTLQLGQEWAREETFRYSRVACTRQGYILNGLRELHLTGDACFPFLNLQLVRQIQSVIARRTP